jgi:hypothetical protein
MIEFTPPLILMEECPKHWMPHDRYRPCLGCMANISRDAILIERGILPVIAIKGIRSMSAPCYKDKESK